MLFAYYLIILWDGNNNYLCLPFETTPTKVEKHFGDKISRLINKTLHVDFIVRFHHSLVCLVGD